MNIPKSTEDTVVIFSKSVEQRCINYFISCFLFLLNRCVEKSPVLEDSSKIKSARGRWSHLSRTLDVKNLIQQVLEMNSQYNYVVSIISKPPEQRQPAECEELIGWFKSRVRKIFTNLKTGK